MSDAMRRHDEFIACRDRCYAALVSQMDFRRTFTDLSWEVAERDAITDAANAWAVSHGYGAVTVHDVERVEHRAMGHSDYASKLALYVAELVVYPLITAGSPPIPREDEQ